MKQVIELRAEPDDYVFETRSGDRSTSEVSTRFLCRTSSLGVRLRDMYATEDAYVSVALTRGVNLTWLSEQTGLVGEHVSHATEGSFIRAKLTPWNSRGSTRKGQKGGVSPTFAPRWGKL